MYGVEVDLKVTCKDDSCTNDLIKCRAYVKNVDGTLKIVNDDVQCEDIPIAENSDISSVESTPITGAIELVHETKTGELYVSVIISYSIFDSKVKIVSK